MPYTYKSLAFTWLIIVGLFAVSATGVVTGRWLILVLLIALATPALMLSDHLPSRAIARAPGRPTALAGATGDSPDPVWNDVYRWENEGGAAARNIARRAPRTSRSSRNAARPVSTD